MRKSYTQKPKKYKQLQPEERWQIEAYCKIELLRKSKVIVQDVWLSEFMVSYKSLSQ